MLFRSKEEGAVSSTSSGPSLRDMLSNIGNYSGDAVRNTIAGAPDGVAARSNNLVGSPYSGLPNEPLENLTPYFIGGAGVVRALLTNRTKAAVAKKAAKQKDIKDKSNTPEALVRKQVQQEADIANKNNKKLFDEWVNSKPVLAKSKDRTKALLELYRKSISNPE